MGAGSEEERPGSEVEVEPNVEQGLRQVERDLKSERRRSLVWERSLRWVVLCERNADWEDS